MAKEQYNIQWSESNLDEVDSKTITRDEFRFLIDSSLVLLPENRRLLLPLLKLEELKRSAKEISAHSWKCSNSCGCPMTAVGAVNLVNYTYDFEGNASSEYKSAVGSFAANFDRLVSERHKVYDEAILEIVG